jgi:TPR repeat protein
LTASREIKKATSAGEEQKTEPPTIGAQQESEVSTVGVSANAWEPSPAFEESGAGSAQSPVGEAPQTFARVAASPTAQTNAVSSRTSRSSLSSEEVTALLTRGDTLVVKGDIASARLFYERAAEAGDGQAALRLGESYDPAFLARAHLSGVRGDALAAARWYRRAHELGTTEAEILLRTISPEKDQRLQ